MKTEAGERPGSDGERDASDGTGRDLLPAFHSQTSPHELSPAGISAEIVPPASLVVVAGPAPGRVYGLLTNECLIGRSPSATVVVSNRAVSSRHAVVRRRGNGFEVVDLGSTNGTLLNGSRLGANSPTELHPGDMLQVADVSLIYLVEGMVETQDVTQALAMLPARSTSTSNLAASPDEVLLQFLMASMPPAEPSKPSLDERVERLVSMARKVRRFLPLVAALGALAALLGVASVAIVRPNSEAAFNIVLTPRASNNPIEERQQAASFEFFSMAESNFLSPALVESTLAKTGTPGISTKLVEATVKRLELINLTPGNSYSGPMPTMYRGVYKHPSEREALRFLKTHVENYLESEIKKTLAVIQRQADFLESAAREKETELRNTEAKLKVFQSKYQDSMPQFADGNVTSLESLRQRQADLQGRSQAAAAAAGAARRELDRMAPREYAKVVRATPYQTALTQAKVALADAQARGFGDSHPEVQRLKAQVAQYEDLAAKELAKAPTQTELAGSPEVSALRRDLAMKDAEAQGIAAELGQVSGQIARLEKIVREMPEVAAEYAELSRSYDVNTATYRKLLQELETTRVQLNLERATTEKRYDVVVPPQSHPPPMRRTLAMRAVVGGAIGVLLGILFVVTRQIRAWYRDMPKRRALAMAEAAKCSPRTVGKLPPSTHGSD